MSALDPVFAALRAVLLAAAPDRPVVTDDPDRVVVLMRPDAGNDWFGAVMRKKNYVSYHLLPLYHDPSLADGMSAALAKRRQGKSCFNFAACDDAQFAEVAALTRHGDAAAG